MCLKGSPSILRKRWLNLEHASGKGEGGKEGGKVGGREGGKREGGGREGKETYCAHELKGGRGKSSRERQWPMREESEWLDRLYTYLSLPRILRVMSRALCALALLLGSTSIISLISITVSMETWSSL